MDTRRTKPQKPYALLMATQASRALFPAPRLVPGAAREVRCDPPSLADPYSLVQTTSMFPAATSVLQMVESAAFTVTDDAWQIVTKRFTFTPPPPGLLAGGDWSFARKYANGTIDLDVDSLAPTPWQIAVPPADITLTLPAPLSDLFRLTAPYEAASAALPSLPKPSLEFIGPLDDLKKIVNALKGFLDVGFDAEVNVLQVGSGTAPAFLIQIGLAFLIGKPEERIDIGVGKFFGQMNLDAALELGTAGISKAPRLRLAFMGDIQQGIIPPLIYAGGLFRLPSKYCPMGVRPSSSPSASSSRLAAT